MNIKLNISLQVLDQIIRSLFSFIIFAYIAKNFSNEYVGAYNLAITILSLLGAFTTMGLQDVIIREWSSNKLNSKNSLITNSVILSALGSFLTLISSFFITIFLNNNQLSINLLLILSVINVFKISDNLRMFFFAAQKFRLLFLIEFPLSFVFFVAKLYFILEKDLNFYLFFWGIEFLVTSILLLFFIKKNLDFTWEFNFYECLKLFKMSYLFLIAGLLIGIYTRLDQLILSKFISAADLSYFYVGLKFNEILIMFSGIIVNTIYPNLADKFNLGSVYFRLYLSKVLKIGFFSFLLYSIGVYFFGGFLLEYFFSPEYSIKSFNFFFIHSISLLFTFWGNISMKVLTLCNDKSFFKFKYIASTLISLVLNLIFTPIYGIISCLVIYILVQFYSGFISDLFSKNSRELVKLKLGLS